MGGKALSPRAKLLNMVSFLLVCVCVCVCVTPNSFKSCTNCEVQLPRPTAMRPNHELLSSGAPSSGIRELG